MDVKLPDGTILRGIPDGTTKEQIASKLKQSGKQVPSEWLAPETKKPLSVGERISEGLDVSRKLLSNTPILGQLAGIAETGASVAAGSVGSSLAGLGGLVGGDVERTQQALSYEPRTAMGQAGMSAASIVPSALAKAGRAAGEKTLDVTRSPIAAAAVDTGVQMLPMVAGARGVRARAAKAEPKAAPSAQAAAAEQRAQTYVSQRTGLNWDKLPARIRRTLTDVAKDAQSLENLDPKALERQALLESLPKPPPATRGQLLRDENLLRQEQLTSATKAGKPIYDIYDAQNKALLENLDILKGQARGTGKARSTAETPEQVGQSVQDQALRAKLKASQQRVTDAYGKAEQAGELQGRVSPRPLIQALRSSPDKTHLGWVESWLNQMDVVSKGPKGETIIKKLSLKELEDLRQAAVARAMNGGTEGFYAGKVIRAIDEATEGGGGKAYQEARKLRREQALEFEDQAAVARLVENKTRTDRATALEDTWRKTVLGGSIEDVQKVRKSLLEGGDEASRAAGEKAWNDIRAQTVQHIIDESTRSVTMRQSGEPNITPASMQKAIKSIGQEKLRLILGPDITRQLNRVLRATRELKTTPPAGHAGSSTVANALSLLERGLAKVPGGHYVSGAVRLVGKAGELGKEGRVVRESQRTPLEESAKESAKRQSLRDVRRRTRGAEIAVSRQPERDQ